MEYLQSTIFCNILNLEYSVRFNTNRNNITYSFTIGENSLEYKMIF